VIELAKLGGIMLVFAVNVGVIRKEIPKAKTPAPKDPKTRSFKFSTTVVNRSSRLIASSSDSTEECIGSGSCVMKSNLA
jgi:hypothetical protein